MPLHLTQLAAPMHQLPQPTLVLSGRLALLQVTDWSAALEVPQMHWLGAQMAAALLVCYHCAALAHEKALGPHLTAATGAHNGGAQHVAHHHLRVHCGGTWTDGAWKQVMLLTGTVPAL